MRAIIIDDENKSRSILTTMLKRYCSQIELIGEATSVTEAYHLVQKVEPDLIFLDINMPGGNGFELLEKLGERKLQIIFVTAYDEYAIQAIRKDALDYLVKPLNIGELQAAVEKAVLLHGELQSPLEFVHISEMMLAAGANKKIAIPDLNGLRFIELKDIIRLEADGSYTRFYLVTGTTVLSTRHLKEYDNYLSGPLFYRVHHSHIVNLDHIVYYERGEGGTLLMSDKSSIALSKRKKKGFLERFKIGP